MSITIYDAFDLEAALRGQPSHEVDLDVGKVVLDVIGKGSQGLDTRIDQSIVDGEIERTIEGASTLTLTVHDPHRAMLRSGMFGSSEPGAEGFSIEATLDKLHWRLCKVSKSGNDLTLTFEDREVAILRAITAPKKASRDKMTRAEFAYSIVREAKPPIPFFCPELHEKQPIAKSKDKVPPAKRKVTKRQGIAPKTSKEKLTVKGAPATSEQKSNAERVLDVAASLGAGQKATEAVIEACIVESLILNLAGGDRDSRGILQVRDSTARPMGIDNRDIEECANAFLTRGFTGKGGAIELERKNPGMTSGQIAQAVQGSAYPNEYAKRQAEAQAFIRAYNGGQIETDPKQKAAMKKGQKPPTLYEESVTTTKLVAEPYQYRRGGEDGKLEDSWACLQRLADEVNWRCYMVAGVCYFISEPELLTAKPSMVLTEDTPGVNAIDFDIDQGKVKDEVTVNCRAERWLAAPGAAVELDDCGPADGRWLVGTISRNLFDAETEIKLHRARPVKAEEAPDMKQEKTTSIKGTSPTLPKLPEGQKIYLGPIMSGHKAVNDWQLTHDTDGLPGYPAYDDMASPYTPVLAPEDVTITRHGSAQGGSACYATGASGVKFWFGHIENAAPVGTTVMRGQRVATISSRHGAPHCHLGIDASAVIGRELDHGRGYTPGGAPVGQQLAKAGR